MRWPTVCLLLASCITRQPGDEPDPEAAGNRIFVTRGSYAGGALALDDARGVDAADAICKLRAKAAGLGGTWIAWLSTTQLDAIDRVTSLGPWHLVGDSVPAFENRAQLYGEPLVALDRDERGEMVTNAVIWTGTLRTGRRSPDTCADWMVTTARGLYGWQATSYAWTEYTSGWCGEEKHLLCVEL